MRTSAEDQAISLQTTRIQEMLLKIIRISVSGREDVVQLVPGDGNKQGVVLRRYAVFGYKNINGLESERRKAGRKPEEQEVGEIAPRTVTTLKKMANVTFYTYPLAFNPAKAKLALDEKGIKYTEKNIDIIGGGSLEPWYIKLNPAGSAPTLVAGEKVIPESAHIIRWADEQGNGPLGGNKVDRQFVSEWITKVDSWDGNLYAAANGGAGSVLKVSNNHKIKVAEAAAKKNPDLADVYKQKIEQLQKATEEMGDKAKVEANKAQLVGLLDEADSRLNSTKYLAGDEYSMADVIFTPVLFRIPQVSQETELLDPRANVKKYWGDLKKRPSYKTTFSALENPFQAAKTALPSLGNILYSKLTNKY